MSEEEWIRGNIRQRKCVVFCKLSDEFPKGCKCYQTRGSHPNPDTNNTEEWTLPKNTVTEPCRDFGEIKIDTKTSKFVRIDVETDPTTTETLLLNVWKLSAPKWIISVMGDVHKSKIPPKETELQTQIQSVVKSLSNGQNIWITTEGINFGVANVIGNALQNDTDESMKNVTQVGIFGWGAIDDDALKVLKDDKSLPVDTAGNRPSVLYPHHLLADDGTENAAIVHQTFQDFRMKLETSLVNHTDSTISLPLVTLLYGGWSYVIDGVKRAIENNIPIIVLQGTGGFANILANVYVASKEDKVKAVTSDKSREWTGTVIDDVLRTEVESQFRKIHGEPYKAGQHIILQCLQKRELITVVDIDKNKNTLTNAIIEALLKCKMLPEVLRMLDYYMPARLFGGEGAAGAAISVMKEKEKALSETAAIFLAQSVLMDQSECAQFIIDYEGVDMLDFIRDKAAIFITVNKDDVFPSLAIDTITDKDRVFQALLIWAIRTRRWKCAALFWKKGNHLLACSLVTTLVLRSMKDNEENIGDKKTLEENAVLFENRAIGLINECYDEEKEDTMTLIQSQSLRNMWTSNLLECCLAEGNRKLFATEAFRKYYERVWYGKINPPIKETYKKPTQLESVTCRRNTVVVKPTLNTPSEREKEESAVKESKHAKVRRIVIAPVTTYVLNLGFYIVFLGLFGHTLLFELGPKYSMLEGIVVVWWLTFVWEEIRQFARTHASDQNQGCRKYCLQQCCCGTSLCKKILSYFCDNNWNILAFVSLLFFLIGAILMTVFHVDNTRTGVYEAARVFLSLDIMFFTWRILPYLAIINIMGLLLEMIYQMVKDLFPFLVIMAVFIISQGLAAHALLYPSSNWTPDSLIDIPKSAFWNIFGELGLDDIEASEAQDQCSSNPLLFENDTKNECPSELGKYTVPFLLGMHMLLMNVLLLNMLIAKFSFTFQKVYAQTEWLAAWQRARVTLDYYRKPPVPPPFNIFFDISYLIYKCSCGKKNKVDPLKNKDDKKEAEMASWERSKAEYYLASSESKSGSERMSIMRENKRKTQEPTGVIMSQDTTQYQGHSIAEVPPRIENPRGTANTDEQLAKIMDTLNKCMKRLNGLSKRMEGLENTLNRTSSAQRGFGSFEEQNTTGTTDRDDSKVILDDMDDNREEQA